jgi:hypothetical protein
VRQSTRQHMLVVLGELAGIGTTVPPAVVSNR